jgi:hypothetical protein
MSTAKAASPLLKSKWSYLGFVNANDEGFTVRFGIDQERFILEAKEPNYNAMYSRLLACWVSRGKLSVSYRSPAGADSTGPFRIEAIDALPPGSDGQ